MSESGAAIPYAPAGDAEVVDICRDLIRIDTTNTGPTRAGERVAAEYVAASWPRSASTPSWSSPSPGGRARGALGARGHRRRPSPLLVHGHLDVVPADADRLEGAPFAGEMRRRLHLGAGRGRHEGLRRHGAVAWSARGPAPGARRGGRSGWSSPPTRRPAARTARTGWSSNHPELFEGCTEAIGEVGGFSLTVQRRPAALPDRRPPRRGMAWLRLNAGGRPATARCARRQRRHRAGRGGGPDRRARVAAADHRRPAGVPGRRLGGVRHRARPGPAGGDAVAGSARSPGWSARPCATRRTRRCSRRATRTT